MNNNAIVIYSIISSQVLDLKQSMEAFNLNILLAALAPVVIIIFIFYRHDHPYNKEPYGLLIKCFIAGLAATFLSIPIALPLHQINVDGQIKSAFFQAYFLAAIPEEIAKFLMLHLVISRNQAFDHYYDGILYAVCLAMGFASLENLFYVKDYGFQTSILRAIFSIPGHMLFAVPMGFFYSFARFKTERNFQFLTLSLIIPIFFHGTYNFGLIISDYALKLDPKVKFTILTLMLAFIILMWRYGLKKITKAKQLN